MILLIDDFRDLTADRVARTFDDGIIALQECVWDYLLLDHDLGDEEVRKTGYGIVCWLEQNPQWRPKRIQLVTVNPVGRQNMVLALITMGYEQHGLEFELVSPSLD